MVNKIADCEIQTPKLRTIVFVTFESEAAPVGGLGAVMKLLPRRIARAEADCLLIAPYFKRITPGRSATFTSALRKTGLCFSVPCGGVQHPVELWQHTDAQGFHTWLIDSPGFFNAPENPYSNPRKPDQLLWDSLFLCAAVPYVLQQLGKTEHVALVLQDWESACTALTAREHPALTRAESVLVLHNFYDKPLSDEALARITSARLRGPTVLSKMIPLVKGPICTVSDNFAAELTHDPLCTRIYAPHLQAGLRKKGVRGINNGEFDALDFPDAAISAARAWDFSLLLAEKQARRARLIEVIEQQQGGQAWGHLDWKDFDGPIFMMFGRDDPCQKGFDLAAAAIAGMPEGQARYIFTPIPGEEGLKGLAFLKHLSQVRPGEVIVFPHRLSEGYKALQQGSSFAIFSSFYEPFGGATEAYAVGTPVLARATGGLIQQVAPYPSACLHPALRKAAGKFHPADTLPSGFLFRERGLSLADVVAGWRAIVDRGYWPRRDRVRGRLGIPLYDLMAFEAWQAILDAIGLYNSDQSAYARMILGGFDMLRRFSWDSAVNSYREVVDLALS